MKPFAYILLALSLPFKLSGTDVPYLFTGFNEFSYLYNPAFYTQRQGNWPSAQIGFQSLYADNFRGARWQQPSVYVHDIRGCIGQSYSYWKQGMSVMSINGRSSIDLGKGWSLGFGASYTRDQLDVIVSGDNLVTGIAFGRKTRNGIWSFGFNAKMDHYQGDFAFRYEEKKRIAFSSGNADFGFAYTNQEGRWKFGLSCFNLIEKEAGYKNIRSTAVWMSDADYATVYYYRNINLNFSKTSRISRRIDWENAFLFNGFVDQGLYPNSLLLQSDVFWKMTEGRRIALGVTVQPWAFEDEETHLLGPLIKYRNERMSLSYSFQFPTGQMKAVSSGLHNLSIGLRIGSDQVK